MPKIETFVYLSTYSLFCITNTTFFFLVLFPTNTVKVIWQLSSFIGGGRPQVAHCALFQARAGTRVESTFHEEAEYIASIYDQE